MLRHIRLGMAAALFFCFWGPASADAQTLRLTVHTSYLGASGIVRVVSGAVGACFLNSECTYYVEKDAIVRLAADYPGRLSGGTGPAAGCALSTCRFTMTADADVTATFTSGDGPSVTVTTTLAGDGTGTITADGVPCASGTCAVTYLQGSSVQIEADAGAAARFTGYSSGTGEASVCATGTVCTFTLNGNASVTATFLALTSLAVAPSSAVRTPGGPPQTFTATGTYSGGVSGVIPPGRGEWSAAPSLPYIAQYLAAAALGGKVYAVGGGGTQNPGDTRLTMFDPATQTWSSRAPMLVSRAFLGATTAGGLLYAIGGWNAPLVGAGSTLASVERYDPVADTWTMRAPLSAARRGLVAGSVNGIIYAAGGADSGGNAVATVEAYDPATDTWTLKAPMTAPRSFVAGGVIDGVLYVVGGTSGTSWVSTVEAYDPATNTWTAKASMPAPLAGAAATVADGVLYVMAGNYHLQSAVYAYDPVADAWSVKAPLRTPRAYVGAAALNGIVYAIGGENLIPYCCNRALNVVETYVDSLRWSSSAPAVARIDQAGVATPVGAGTATIMVAVGAQTCGASCPVFIVPPPTDLSLDAPVNNSSVARGAMLTIGGWALNRAAPTGTGVDAIHVYAVPDGGNAIFLGVAPYGGTRADVGAIFGAQFINSGFTLQTDTSPAAGSYTVIAYAHNALTQQFDAAKSARITITPPVSQPFVAVDTPQPSQVVTSAFEVGGWALDAGATTGAGVDAVHFYVFPNDGASPGVFIGSATYGLSRPDVGAIFGPRFTASGFHFTITGLGPGAYLLGVYAHSTVTNAFSIVQTLHFTVNATALMSIDTPGAESTVAAATFNVDGWSFDRSVEGTGQTGTGVDTLHVYAYPNPGSGQAPIFLGVASVGLSRPDVGALYGSRYATSGYTLTVDRAALGLAAGVYNIAVHSHSTVTNAFNNVAVVRVTLQ